MSAQALLNSEKLNQDSNSQPWSILGRSDSDVKQQIHKIVERTALSKSIPVERRLDKRFAFPYLLTVTPLGNHGLFPVDEPTHVVGKFLAERGMDFFHTANLPFRRAIVSFSHEGESLGHLALNISWSRFLKPGWYDSGGRFTHILGLNE